MYHYTWCIFVQFGGAEPIRRSYVKLFSLICNLLVSSIAKYLSYMLRRTNPGRINQLRYSQGQIDCPYSLGLYFCLEPQLFV